MRAVIILCFSFLYTVAWSQGILQEYINLGLENNLALLQKEAGYRQSLEVLKEARGLFYPSIALNARYTVSEGGRVIEFPVGDLLNPVYQELDFPYRLKNEEIRFLRPTEHETKLRLVQPVFNSDIFYNARIKKEISISEEINLVQYKRELTAEIKKAYYAVGMAEGVLAMMLETKALLMENVRVNTKLVENNKVTLDNLYRSQTEQSKFEQTIQQAIKNRQVAVAYFNFLLNRQLSDSVIIEQPPDRNGPAGNESDYMQQALLNREEIRNLEQYSHISDLAVDMNRSARFPNLLAVADYGFQGEEYAFNKNRDYMQASLVLSWDLFAGLQHQAKIKQALISKEKLTHQLGEAKNQISLQVISAWHEVKASEAGLTAAEDQVKTAREGFRLVKRKYEEGQASLIEFMDARNALTQAEENLIITHYTLLINLAEFEKVTAISNL
jgi:outer membrane protein